MTTPKFARSEDARKAGYHSRRHVDRTAMDAARSAYLGRKKKAVVKRVDPLKQLAALDAMFGPGNGAAKERAKLKARIAAQKTTAKKVD
jgi:hypothetical protein